jgi:acyl carrier protein
MTPQEARELISRSILRIIPDADLASLDDAADMRRSLELDSLDFLGLVEMLSSGTGVRIDEVDYPELASMGSSVGFLVDRTKAS